MSPQQVLHNIYTLVALAELKGYAMMQYSLTLQRYFTNESFHAEEELLRETTEQRSTEKVAATIAAMKTAGRQVWRCDPEKHVENETFVQLTELLQGYVQNERDLNSDQACTSTCGYYTYTKVFSCSDAELCYRQRLCRGKVVKCEPLGMSGSVCLSEQRYRRYDRLVFSDTRGPAPTCSTPAVLLNSWYQLLLLKKCSYCFCVCDEDGPYSDRHFSLRPAVSDVDAGFVVIGVRIVKLNRVIHLQAQ
ncbi:Hypothetical predicted protein [Cloeon dipterum]|uniref:Uncharacterized protein n=1 Tax=Cloeon dipterum TaxID=197152 RepID=A0A8S1E8M9_9INSE|nr:Hypothetical predicted protein [Cloeon dipterum]